MGIGLKSLGSSSRWTARNSKPALRRASAGNWRRSSRDDPTQVSGFSLIPTMPDQVYCDVQESSSCTVVRVRIVQIPDRQGSDLWVSERSLQNLP